MKDYGRESEGWLKVTRVASLPEFTSAEADEGKILYVEDDGEFYIGTSTRFQKVGTSWLEMQIFN